MNPPHCPNPQSPLKSSPIGLFDSGVGGLSVLNCLRKAFPKENYLYFGDTLNMPYGSKSFEEIRGLVSRILEWMCDEKGVKLVAVACNTSAGVLYHDLKKLSSVPIIEPITPICQVLAVEGRFTKVGLIATPTTVLSNRYETVLKEVAPHMTLHSMACDGLARMIESGQQGSDACDALLKGFLTPLVELGIEALILGCTHYPHAATQIRKHLPASVVLLDPAEAMAHEVEKQMERTQCQGSPLNPGKIDYYLSDNPVLFQQTSAILPLSHLPPLSITDLKCWSTQDEKRTVSSFSHGVINSQMIGKHL
ncbi:MAG: glutamate racemase [Cyanobacteria bacterium]|nr:glutamate racemase [Cyanobacteriota bacterium]